MKKIVLLIIVVLMMYVCAGCRGGHNNCISIHQFISASDEQREVYKDLVISGDYHYECVYSDWGEYRSKCNKKRYYSAVEYERFVELLMDHDDSDPIIDILNTVNWKVSVITVGKVEGGEIIQASGDFNYRSFIISTADGGFTFNKDFKTDYYYAVTTIISNNKRFIVEISNIDYERLSKHFSVSSELMELDLYWLS